jgi:hypothetical protein
MVRRALALLRELAAWPTQSSSGARRLRITVMITCTGKGAGVASTPTGTVQYRVAHIITPDADQRIPHAGNRPKWLDVPVRVRVDAAPRQRSRAFHDVIER